MKKTACAALAAGLILFVFSACGTAPAAVTPPPTPEPVVQTPPPAAPEGRYGFDVLPVTEEDIKAFYAKEGYYTVQKVTPYEGDFLVTVGYGAGEENSGLLY